ncbi:hypothetical protein TNCV_1706781 [Trichonephila clavipes]|uniref:Transposase n=1 Tax=Trichonephila clavipes TaxID=2585209 RepID=A0A8X6V256_TRICX|nr:hypothetical protein TNCV_1706781 [Trichonephila clavipes]
MDDSATCHRTLAVQDCLDSEGIQRLVWPARSPDLNPIENVWDALGRQVAGRNYPPTNKNTLIRALTEEWDKLPQQLLDNVVQSMFNINGISTSASRLKLDQVLDLADVHRAQIIALPESNLKDFTPPLRSRDLTFIEKANHGGGLAFLIQDLTYQSIDAKHLNWGCSGNNQRGLDLINMIDDSGFCFLNDGTPTQLSYNYATVEALDVVVVSTNIFRRCNWSVLGNIRSDHLPILIKLDARPSAYKDRKNVWNFNY